MKSINAALDPILPYFFGAAWGICIYKKQDHTLYDNLSQKWGWTKLANKVQDLFTTGVLGALTAAAVSSYQLSSIDSQLAKTANPWLDRGIRVFAWLAFFYYSAPSNDPGYKAFYSVLKTARKLRNFFGNFDGSITQAKCVKEIYSQSFIQNFKIAPQDFLLPLLSGLAWGLLLYNKQDSTLDPNQRSNNIVIRQLDEKLKTGTSGKVIAATFSSLSLFTVDQLARPFFPKNLLGGILRFSPWVIYGLLSIPNRTAYVKAISQLSYAIFHTFRFTFFSLQTFLAYNEIKEIFCYKNIQKNPLGYLIPVSIGAIYQIILGKSNAPLIDKNSLLVKWITMPSRIGGDKLRTISNIAYLSLCFLMVYQLSTGLEGHSQKVFPESVEKHYDHILNTWWNFYTSINEDNLLFKSIFMVLKENYKFNKVYGEQKKFIQFINKWDILERIKLILKFRKEADKINEIEYIPQQPSPPMDFDLRKSHLLAILEILVEDYVV